LTELKILQRFIVSLLALLMFTTSACFAIDTHYCGDEAQSWSLFSKAEACDQMAKRLKSENKELPPCCQKLELSKEIKSNSSTHFSQKPCCYNKSLSFKNDASENGQSVDIVVSAIEIDILQFFNHTKEVQFIPLVPNKLHVPPSETRKTGNIYLIHQAFII
jgi:hypothetical protein